MSGVTAHPAVMAYACVGIVDDMMQPDPGDAIGVAAAKAVCNRCTSVSRCLDDALSMDKPDGVWGGYTGDEIRWIKAGISPEPCIDCGTSIVPRTRHQQRCGVCSAVIHVAVRKKAAEPGRHPCGTLAALLQHQAAGEPIDDECADAHRKQITQRNARKRRSRSVHKPGMPAARQRSHAVV